MIFWPRAYNKLTGQSTQPPRPYQFTKGNGINIYETFSYLKNTPKLHQNYKIDFFLPGNVFIFYTLNVPKIIFRQRRKQAQMCINVTPLPLSMELYLVKALLEGILSICCSERLFCFFLLLVNFKFLFFGELTQVMLSKINVPN